MESNKNQTPTPADDGTTDPGCAARLQEFRKRGAFPRTEAGILAGSWMPLPLPDGITIPGGWAVRAYRRTAYPDSVAVVMVCPAGREHLSTMPTDREPVAVGHERKVRHLVFGRLANHEGCALVPDNREGIVDGGQRDEDAILSAIRDMDQKFTLGQLIAHYTDLLQRGYRATRWHHPRFGVEEMLPSGQWMFSAIHPDSKAGSEPATDREMPADREGQGQTISDGNISPEALAQIEALCEAMDKEDILAGTPSGHGRTLLDDTRDLWMQCALEGKRLPDRWCADEIEARIQERLAQHGTREWRKAYPDMVERMRKCGLDV